MKTRLPLLAEKSDCTGCMACVASCKHGALIKVRGDDGHVYLSVVEEKCIGCLQCERVCKDARGLIGSNDLKASEPYAAWARDDYLRAHSTSGGIAAAVGCWVVENGGSVAGVSFDGRHASHTIVNEVSQLTQFQGSKYVWSDCSTVYKEIETVLPKGKVLFVGTGCQVAGVLAFFKSNPYRSNLYTMDLICGGVPSDLLMESFFRERPEVGGITSFRTKRRYELKGYMEGAIVALPQSSLPISGFCAEQTMRHACYDCPFAFVHRKSDITIGDLWGCKISEKDIEKGVSLVIVHNEKGADMLASSDVCKQKMDWSQVLPDNPRLAYGHTPKTVLRRLLSKNYFRMSSSEFRHVYSLTSRPYQIRGFVYRLLVFIRRRINNVKRRRAILKILQQC